MAAKPRPAGEIDFRRQAERLNPIGDPIRLHVLLLLARGEMRRATLRAEIGGEEGGVSKHLGLLRAAGLRAGTCCESSSSWTKAA